MTWFIIYIIGGIIAVLLAARRIERSYDPKIQDSPECTVSYPIAFFGSWISVLLIVIYGR